MRKLTHIVVCAAGLFLFSGISPAGEKKLMHCFAFTPIESATPAEWKAFYADTQQKTKKIPGISHVWYGKLRRALTVDGNDRQYGVCMEMANEDTLKTYTDHAFHKQWMDV